MARVAVALAFGAVGFFYCWTVKSTAAVMIPHGQQRDYYNLLVDGFQEGHLYMKTPVDPQLLALRPEQRPGGAPYLLDASVYDGHYYLYFGVTPAVVLYWPFSALTGQDLPEASGALVFMLLGFGFGSWWWLEVRREFFPRLSLGWLILGILALGFCSAAPSALRRPLFYEVAIGAGYAFSMLALWAVTRAWLRPHRGCRWLIVAGVAVAFAAGSRANLAPAGLLFLVAGCFAVAWRAPRPLRARALGWALLAGGLGAGTIGCGLGAYNYARFGNALEFGHRYQMGTNPKRMFRPQNLRHNFSLYYLKPPALNGYFPFVAPADESLKPADYVGREHVHGEWIWTPLVILALAALLVLLRGDRRSETRGWLCIIALPALLFGVNGIIVGLTGVRANRYMLDFHPALILATLGAVAPLLIRAGTFGRIARGLVALVLPVAVLFNVLASMQVHGFFASTAPETYQHVAAVADRVVWPLLRTNAADVGDREVKLRWPTKMTSRLSEPLLSAGTMDFSDIVWIEYDGPARARIIYQHGEYGDAPGEWFAYEPGARAKIQVAGALLLPGISHPWYGSRTADERLILKRNLRVTIDGTDRFCRDVLSYDSSPHLQHWGEWHRSDGMDFRFTGTFQRILSTSADEDRVQARRLAEGAVRLRLELPQDRYGLIEPILQSGSQAAFDTLAVRYVRPGVVQLVHDQVGGGARWSEEFAVDYKQQHRVEVELPFASDGLVWTAKGPVETHRPPAQIKVRWNGQDVFAPVLPPLSASNASVSFGVNWWNSSVGRALFGGTMMEQPRLLPLGRIRIGELECRTSLDALDDPRGIWLNFKRRDGETAALLWQRSPGSSKCKLGWLDAGVVTWSPELDETGTSARNVRLQISQRETAPGKIAEEWVEVEIGGRVLLAHKTNFFSTDPIEAWALLPGNWSGSALDHGTKADVAEVPRLPGRVRIRFLLPPDGSTGGDPLLSAGKTGAADSIFLRSLGGNRYIVGLDHWGVGTKESPPVSLAADEPHTLVIEMGSLFADPEVPKDRLRLWLDGQQVVDTTLALYPVKPDEIAFGRNPLGMSTSGSGFRGELISVRSHQPEDEGR